jgi:hypothetical protein
MTDTIHENPIQNVNGNVDRPIELVTNTQENISVILSRNLPSTQSDQVWSLLHEGFVDLNSHSREKQDMERDEFDADVQSSNVLKFVAYDMNENPVGALFVHEGLDSVPWIDKNSIQDEQDKVDPEGTPYYVSTIVVGLEHRGTAAAATIIQSAFLYFQKINQESGHNNVCYFDCADANYPWLAEFIGESANRQTEDYPGVPTAVRELFTEYFTQLADQDTLNKVKSEPDQSSGMAVVDKQHFYALQLENPA